jgi:hypothetical protein
MRRFEFVAHREQFPSRKHPFVERRQQFPRRRLESHDEREQFAVRKEQSHAFRERFLLREEDSSCRSSRRLRGQDELARKKLLPESRRVKPARGHRSSSRRRGGLVRFFMQPPARRRLHQRVDIQTANQLVTRKTRSHGGVGRAASHLGRVESSSCPNCSNPSL